MSDLSRRDFLKGLSFAVGVVAVPGTICAAAELLEKPKDAPVKLAPSKVAEEWGQKTLRSADPLVLDRVGTRRMVTYIQKKMEATLYAVTLEPNDAQTRALVQSASDAFMNEIEDRGGVATYLVKCNDENNPPMSIDAHRWVLDVFLKTRRGVGVRGGGKWIHLRAVFTGHGIAEELETLKTIPSHGASEAR